MRLLQWKKCEKGSIKKESHPNHFLTKEEEKPGRQTHNSENKREMLKEMPLKELRQAHQMS